MEAGGESLGKPMKSLVNYTVYNLLIADLLMGGLCIYIRDLSSAAIAAGLGFLCLVFLNNN